MRCSTSSDRSRHRRPADRGQAAVEFAIVLPAVVVLVLGIVQVVVVATNQVTVEYLARAGARAASAAADPASAARTEIDRSTRLSPVAVDVAMTDDTVTVTVTYVDGTSVPVIGRVIGDVELTGRASMRREPP